MKKMQYLCVYQLDKLAMAMDSIEGHHINFKDTRPLARTAGYIDWLVKEAFQIWLHQAWWWRQKLSKTLAYNSSLTQLIA
jgi:hypothetical protein